MTRSKWLATLCAVDWLLFLATVHAEVKVNNTPFDVLDGTPTLVTLDLENVTVPEAFAAVFAKSPIPASIMITNKRTREMRITLHLQDTPLAEALLRVAREADVGIARWNGRCDYSTYELKKAPNATSYDENWVHGPVNNVSAFAGVLQHVEVRQSLSLEDTNKLPLPRNIMASMVLIPEPQVNLCAFGAFAGVTDARDENGVRTSHPSDAMQFVPGSENIHSSPAVFDLPSDFGKTIAVLELEQRLQIVARYRRIDIDVADLVDDVHATTDGVAISMKAPVNRRNFGLEYTVRFDRNHSDGADLLAKGSMICLIDAAGRVMRTLHSDQRIEEGGKKVTVIRSFSSMWGNEGHDATPVKLILLMALEGREVKPVFHFEGIPLSAIPEPEL